MGACLPTWVFCGEIVFSDQVPSHTNERLKARDKRHRQTSKD